MTIPVTSLQKESTEKVYGNIWKIRYFPRNCQTPKVKSSKTFDTMILVSIFRRLNHHRNLCTTRSSFILRKEPKPNPWIPNDGNIKYYMAIGLIPTGKKHAQKKYD